ncbi:B3 domain-containing transcription factor VRN1-like [Trifolium pratense]|uniref:B3 domain-containing transcription factor VRN1-like n=1 Tax=Trifolium pratense TaxID=57577 RepID=UPI001E692CB9|nr:B3 domain-containing transcription factor VRN1-like [Trifolium pratense]
MTSNRKNKHTLPASTIRFFRIITSTILQDEKLRIPNSFTRKHGSNMTNPIFLKTPDGKKWEIYTTKINDGDFWFQKGWKEFATHYSLDHGHMVLFEYEENSQYFRVHIFGKSGLEIEYPFHDNQHEENSFDQISDDDSIEILDKSPSCKKTRPKSPIPCSQPHKKLRSDTREDVGTSSKFHDFPQNHDQSSDDTSEGDGKSSKFYNMPKYDHVEISDNTADGSVKCQKVEQEKEQEELSSKINEALNRARSFKSKNPCFTIVMKSSYLYSYSLYVPTQFAINYLKKEESNILLKLLNGRTWYAKYCFGKIKSGWKNFVRDNKLKVGDVCVFELTKSQALTLRVLIFRVDDEEPHSSSLPQVQRDEDISEVESENYISIDEDEKEPQRTSLRSKVKLETNEAQNAADNFTSKHPFFKINIMPNQRGHSRLLVPNSFIREYLDSKEQTVMLKFGKKFWPVKLLCYSNMKSGQFSRGWNEFWEENKLKGGDVCVFELIKTEDVVLHVHIFRGN